MSINPAIFGIVVGEEGGWSATPADKGDWTGGACGFGECLGTNFGIDTASYADGLAKLPMTLRASYPGTVRALTLAQARTYYDYAYWQPLRCDDMPPPLALIVFDAGVNNGISRSAKWLQQALGVKADGQIGPATIAAVHVHDGTMVDLCAEVLAQRICFMGGLPTWATFGLGWSRRLAMLPFHAMTLAGQTITTGPLTA